MATNTMSQENYIKLVQDYLDETGLKDNIKDNFFTILVKYSKYENVRNFIIETILSEKEHAQGIKNDLAKTDFKDKVKENLYNTIMKNNYLADIGNIVIASRAAVEEECNNVIDQYNKTGSEKDRNSLQIKAGKLKQEYSNLNQMNVDIGREVNGKIFKEAKKARKTIDKRLEKLSKKIRN